MKWFTITSLLILTILGSTGFAVEEHVLMLELPEAYDLRADGYVTSVKDQRGGTCWTHGTMASIESNLLITGIWSILDLTGQPNLAEYHLDWWNGFNRHHNGDLFPSSGNGLTVHQGGDYLVTTAYITRGDGVVYYLGANDNTELDDTWFELPPNRRDTDYLLFYPRDVEWYNAGEDLSNMDTIKQALMTHGAIATCFCVQEAFFSPNNGWTHYQPPNSSLPPNHSVAIIGWDDNKDTQAPEKGAWLVKNSWGSRGMPYDYLWISYYDKHCGKDPEMGAVSFQHVEPLAYDHFYYHDYHGWRDTKTDCAVAFNAFIAGGTERIKAVSFVTAADDVNYTIKIFDRFEEDQLENELSVKTGHIAHTGFHTIDLETSVPITEGDDFYVYLELSNGGHAYDCTSYVKVLLTDSQTENRSEPTPVKNLYSQTAQRSFLDTYASTKMALENSNGTRVNSTAQPNQSYYLNDDVWIDLYDFDNSANFCIKALTTDVTPDINRDGIVDQEDVDILESALGSEIGTSSWNPDCDLNLDNAVNQADYDTLMQQWLQELPPIEWPIAYWKLDEATGQYARDSAENNYVHAYLMGDPNWLPEGGAVDGAIELDGIDDYISTPYFFDPAQTYGMSVFAWIKGGAPGQVIVSQEDGVNWLTADPTDGALRTDLRTPERSTPRDTIPPGPPLISSTVVTDGEWHQIGFVLDGIRRLYVDGAEVAGDTTALFRLEGSEGGLYLGAGSALAPETFFSGLIDDVRIYNKAVKP
jgi:C1A family cysteine protease